MPSVHLRTRANVICLNRPDSTTEMTSAIATAKSPSSQGSSFVFSTEMPSSRPPAVEIEVVLEEVVENAGENRRMTIIAQTAVVRKCFVSC